MRSDQFIIEREDMPVGCNLIATLYSEDSNRAFAIYSEVLNPEKKYKVAELKRENGEVIFEDLDDIEEIKEIWIQYQELCNKMINEA